jgi:hypothetical protein
LEVVGAIVAPVFFFGAIGEGDGAGLESALVEAHTT